MTIDKSTRKYEAWLAKRIPLIPEDLKKKHSLMRDGAFAFLRATFYRWAQVFPEACKEAASAPIAIGVGDLHVENFGTWRDIEGRLIWGVNDFDEACWLPYTCDLVRLAASAHLAIESERLKISSAQASKAILDGYQEGLKQGGGPFVLAEHHHALRQMAVERLKDPATFWEKINGLRTVRRPPPSSAEKALRRLWIDGDPQFRVVHRVSGLGSLGRRRYVAVAQWRGSLIAREAKELSESAWRFAQPQRGKATILYQHVLDHAIRCPDPFVRLRGRWIVRRLAPDCSRIELASLPARHDAARLLHAMGWETANVHLGSREARVMLRDLNKRPPEWLHSAAGAMLDSVRRDWKEWRRRT
jgi:hypothetical protein